MVDLWVSQTSHPLREWPSYLGIHANLLVHSVESQGRTLEQLDWVYNQPKPVKASQKVDKVVVQADGKVTEKIVEDVEH